jgi:type III secretion protein R
LENIGDMVNPIGLFVISFGSMIVPIVIITSTSFMKIIIVLSILRTAIGANSVPPTYVNNVIAAAMTIFIMASPIAESVEILENSKIDMSHFDSIVKNIQMASNPMFHFMTSNTGIVEQNFFQELRERQWSDAAKARFSDTGPFVVVPSFILSEVKKGFEMGFLIYIPFTIVDVVTASILSSLGMQSVSPNIITLPLKLLLFVHLDGWTNLFNKLIQSYI